ncbi:MAG: hypothetical protein RIE31_05095 [Alphaproteobacteria bacterium]
MPRQVYEVQIRSPHGWRIVDTCTAETEAMATAHTLVERGRNAGVRVVVERMNEETGRFFSHTLFRYPKAPAGATSRARQAGDDNGPHTPGTAGLSAASDSHAPRHGGTWRRHDGGMGGFLTLATTSVVFMVLMIGLFAAMQGLMSDLGL